MADGTAETGKVLLFNRSTQPQVPNGAWGSGVVRAGEHIEVDAAAVASYSPDIDGSPWTLDTEAARAVLSARAERLANPPGSPQDAVSGAQDGSHDSSGDPPVHVTADGDVVTDTGAIVGHIEPANSATTTTQEDSH